MSNASLRSVMVANRGEIARRVIRSARELGIRTIAVHSTADAELPYVEEADTAVNIGEPQPAQSYLNVEALLDAAKRTGADAVHPGYGFLSEDADFARAVLDAGLTWVGPSPEVIAAMGNKAEARRRMASAGVPVAPGSRGRIDEPEQAIEQARAVGFPLMVKAAAGGGGLGMAVVHDPEKLAATVESVSARADRLFRSGEVLLERFVESARHVEVQIFGMGDGTVVCLGERDCSVQRRHQKVVEEAPAARLTDVQRAALHRAAVTAGETVGYTGAGTVEFLLDLKSGEFYFLEMNTRLQVEHPVTELVTAVDLVAAQLLVAGGDEVGWDRSTFTAAGHAVELRIYAEDSTRFLPSPGQITRWREPVGEHIRVDSGYREGNVVTPFYDPLIAKLCAWGQDRREALERARGALVDLVVEGPKTNREFLLELLAEPRFLDDEHDTSVVSTLRS